MATRPECPYCGKTTGLRQVHEGCGTVPAEYTCEGCFTATDDGPCFDDLPVVATTMTPREAGEAAFYECEGNNAAALKAAFDAYEAASKPGGEEWTSTAAYIPAYIPSEHEHAFVTVRPLEWNACDRADVYAVKPTYGSCGAKPFMLVRASVIFSEFFDTPEEAKAFAQADYEARIRAALVSPLTHSKEA